MCIRDRRAPVRFVAKQLEKHEMIVNIFSFSYFRHLWQLINMSEIGNLQVSNHVISPQNVAVRNHAHDFHEKLASAKV